MLRTSMPRAGAACLRWIATGIVLLLHAQAASAQRSPADTIQILSIEFDGVEQVSKELLRASIESTATTCISAALLPVCWLGVSLDRHYLNPQALAADQFRVRVFYYERGFRETRVQLDTVREGTGIHIRFRVQEGRPIRVRAVSVEGAENLPRSVVRNLPVRAGMPFSMIDFELSRDSIVGRAANLGYADAQALKNYEISRDDPYSADVAYQLIPGPLTHFGPVTVTGADRISPAVVRRMLTFREGDLFSRTTLLSSQRNLFSLDMFRRAEIIPGVLSADSILPVEVRVIEDSLYRARFGIGANTIDFVSAEGRLVSRNFLGGARQLELRGRVNNIGAGLLGVLPTFQKCTGIYCDIAGSFNIDFTQPWFLRPANTLGAGAFIERFTLPGVYVRTTRGGYISLRRSIAGAAITGGYRPELTALESDGDLIFCVNFVACEERDIDVLRDPHWLAPIALSLGVDRANSIFNPTAGYIFRFDSEFAAPETGSDFDYVRLVSEGAIYHDPFRGVVIASRLRAGWARAVGAPGAGLGLHPQKRFFAGGPNSVRGYSQYRLGPKLLTVDARKDLVASVAQGGAGCTAQEVNAGSCDVTAFVAAEPGRFREQPVGGAAVIEGNVEVRFPVVGELLRGAAFVDFGQVWQGYGDARLRDLQWTPGAGVRYFSPIGPVRVDVGYNPAGAERLTVVTTEVCDNRARPAPCTALDPDFAYAPGDVQNRRKLRTLQPVMYRPFDSFLDRLQLHFSIGQAF